MAGSALGRPEGATAERRCGSQLSAFGPEAIQARANGLGMGYETIWWILLWRNVSGGRQGRAASLLHQSQPHLAGINHYEAVRAATSS
jgi:hypothetical protein